ncbi:MAG: GYD domain-containing protein [Rhizobiales bacterium]|nr:GYD domain-containing protein [Hyphomicrobiales bacterium]
MPRYMIQVAYTSGSAKAMVEHPQNREQPVRQAIESVGGKLESFYFCFGPFDVVLIVELPDHVSAMAMALATTSSGGVSRFETTPLFSAADAMAAMTKAKSATYSPPA